MPQRPEDRHIRTVYAEEKRRGRRPIDEERRRKRTTMYRLAEEAIRNKDERAFLNALREGDVKDGTDEFALALQLFRQKIGRP